MSRLVVFDLMRQNTKKVSIKERGQIVITSDIYGIVWIQSLIPSADQQ